MPESCKNLRFTVAYDGREFYGWQRNANKKTVQGCLETALTAVFEAPVEVRGAGRTDRGAHARGQVAHAWVPRTLELPAVQQMLAQRLPEAVRVRDLQWADMDFHARTSAIGKRYRYAIHNAPEVPASQRGRVWHVRGRLDPEAMQAVLPAFVGTLDFASFATPSGFDPTSTTRTVTTLTQTVQGPRIELTIEADGFLYKMVRNIVRTVVKAGEGRYTLKDVRRILAACSRQAAPGTAPASGLTLDEVFYSESRPESEPESGR